MVESSGTELCWLLQLSMERPACYTCEQEGEELQKCRQRNVLSESMQQGGGRQEGGQEEVQAQDVQGTASV